MVSFSSIATLAFAAVATAGSAPIAKDSPVVTYMATVKSPEISALFEFVGNGSDIYVSTTIEQHKVEGHVYYYIHESAIPKHGTCADAKGIFNPYNGTYPISNQTITGDVAVGDFPTSVGLFQGDTPGAIISSPGSPYWSLNPNNTAFIGNLSVVFQYANKTPIACANIVRATTSTSSSGASKMAGAAAALPLAAGVAALLI